MKKPDFGACLKSNETKTVTSSNDYRNYENYFKINKNKSISSLTIGNLNSKDSDCFEDLDGLSRKTRSNSDACSEEDCDMQYTCFENSRTYSCPCMQHSLKMFN